MFMHSTFPDLHIPERNIVTELFPDTQPASDKPLWIDSKDPSHNLSPAQALVWARRLAVALDREKISQGSVVLLVTPNHIFIPAAYFGIVGSGRIFRYAEARVSS